MKLKEMHVNGYLDDRAVAVISLVRCGFTNAEAEEIIDKIQDASSQATRQPWTRWTEEQKDRLLNMHAEGRSLQEMAETLDRSIRQVQSALTRFKERRDA